MVARPRVPLTHSGVVVVVVVVALALAVAAGASIDARPRAPQDPVFRASLDQVRVDVAVTRGDTPVANLTASHFEVRDNGVLQTVDRVHREEVPLRFVLVLDTSASVAGNQLSALVTAAQSLVRALRADDDVGLVAFSHVLRLSVAPTTRHADTLTALASLRAGGTTAWRDALFAGVQLAGGRAESRPVVLLFSDGVDTSSWMGATAIEEAVRRSGTIVHAVGLMPRGRGRRPNTVSRSLQLSVDAGGGRFWGTESPDELGSRFSAALNELRARYLLVYTPRETPSPGWHDVRVRLTGARGDVRARPGYYVPAP